MPQRFVPFAVTVCGLDELAGHCGAGVSHVLSILDPEHEGPPPGLGGYGPHERLELRFHDIIDPWQGQSLPRAEHVEAILRFGRDLMERPEACRHLLVHCHAGISRSTAALVMLLAQARPDRPAAEAVAAVAGIRKKAWPNLRMTEFADAMLDRRGELVAAVRARHHAVATERPEFIPFMLENGRRREVEALLGS